jgi:hypothetical protein
MHDAVGETVAPSGATNRAVSVRFFTLKWVSSPTWAAEILIWRPILSAQRASASLIWHPPRSNR